MLLQNGVTTVTAIFFPSTPISGIKKILSIHFDIMLAYASL